MDFVLVSAISIADSSGSSPKICAEWTEELVDPGRLHEQPGSQIYRGVFRAGQRCESVYMPVSAKIIFFRSR